MNDINNAIPPASHGEAVKTPFDVRAFVDGYEFRGDEGDRTPTEDERAMLEDFAHGLIDATTSHGEAVAVGDDDGSLRWAALRLAQEAEIDGPFDFINVPEKRTVWVNVYAHRIGGPYLSKADADDDYRFATDTRIACVPLTYTVGEGL